MKGLPFLMKSLSLGGVGEMGGEGTVEQRHGE